MFTVFMDEVFEYVGFNGTRVQQGQFSEFLFALKYIFFLFQTILRKVRFANSTKISSNNNTALLRLLSGIIGEVSIKHDC